MSNFTDFLAAAGGQVDVQEFATSGTWTKPDTGSLAIIELWGAGGGGGGGARQAAGTNRGGGFGGGGGGKSTRVFKLSDLPSTVSVTVGAGGTGGAARAFDTTTGINGTSGGSTTFGTYAAGFGGGGGQGGSTTITSISGVTGGGFANLIMSSSVFTQAGGELSIINNGNSTSPNSQDGGGGGSSIPSGGTPVRGGSSINGGAGGGHGAILNSSNLNINGTAGGGIVSTSSANNTLGGAAGINGGGAGSNGTAPVLGLVNGSGGGGGGSGYTTALDINRNTMAYGNGTFAAITSSGQIVKSSNGTGTWDIVESPTFANSGELARGLLHNGTNFVVFTSSRRTYSTTDFATFTAISSGATSVGGAGVPSCFKYINSKYFIVDSNGNFYQSDDAITFTQITSVPGNVTDICWTGTNYVVTIGDAGGAVRIAYSTNLSSWTDPTGTRTSTSYFRITNNGATVVAMSTSGASISTNHGVTFANTTTSLSGSVGVYCSMAYLNSTWFATAANNLYTSTDGTNWTTRISATGNNLGGGFAYNGTTYVIGTSAVAKEVAKTAVPADLATWTARNSTETISAGGTGGNGGGVAGGGGGGGASNNGYNSGAGGNGANGYARITVI